MSIRDHGPARAGIGAVIGATATGKTQLGVDLALQFNGEIINADARLFYRGMDIGTAKPDVDARRGIPHHLIDILDPTDSYSLSEFLEVANTTIRDIIRRGKLPILVGGSGQYIWALLEGWQLPKIAPNPALRRELETLLETDGIAALQSSLRDTGARGIERVEMQNPRRLIRAIERAVATGDATGGAGKSEIPPYDALVIGLTAPREVLHYRVAKRLELMLDSGWQKEVESLKRAGVDRDLPAMSAIGYRQLLDFLDGDISWDSMIEETLIGNHRLIGAQNNWFKKRDKRIIWLDIATPDFKCDAAQIVLDWLNRRSDQPLALESQVNRHSRFEV